jgi:hypothetical protein
VGRLNWEKDSIRRKLKNLDSHGWKQKKLALIPDDLNKLFEKAITRTSGGSGYSVALSMKRHFLLRGWLSIKQTKYLKSLAGDLDSAS